MVQASRRIVTQLRPRGRIRPSLTLLGPAFVASVAYVDPGNFAVNFAAGAARGYQLAWVVVVANLAAMGIQYRAATLGLVTGQSLPELCRPGLGRRGARLMWLQAEAVAMATDVAEFIGAAIGLNLLFGMPLPLGGLVTAAIAGGLLWLEQRGYRRYELAIVALLALVGAGFVVLFFRVGGQHYGQLARGLTPTLTGAGTASLAAGIVGATVMPHAIYLHSALHKNRVAAASPAGRATVLAANRWDCLLGLGAAGIVNLTMLCVAAARFRQSSVAAASDFSLIHDRLTAVAGGGAALVFSAALLASGLSSATVGTQAGQVIMDGFTGRRLPLIWRRALTAAPSLVILALAVSPGQVLLYSQVLLSFGIPFALVPLLLLTRDPAVMGGQASGRVTTLALLLVTVLVTGLNVYLIGQLLAGLL
ncbi:MAG TPA: Nramp family divalent metal transporter [Trebonia sp.]